jgi:lipoate-protein ligase A
VAKLVGTAQRVVRGAWLFSAVLVFDDADLLRPLLAEIYRSLELPFDPTSVGALRQENPALTLEKVTDAVVAAYAERTGLAPASLSPDLLDAAAARLHEHRA